MKTILILLTLVLVLLGPLSWDAAGEVNLGVSIGDKGVKGFYLAVGDYFRVPEREVVVIKERRIPDDEVAVVLFLSHHARVSPSVILNLRLSGRSWMDICFHYHLSPDIFYVPVGQEIKGPPYGNAYGYYNNKKKKNSERSILKDADVVNLVNLKFISEHYGHSPEAVIKMRSEGRNFVAINDEIKKGKKEKQREDKFVPPGGEGNGRGHGKGKGKWK